MLTMKALYKMTLILILLFASMNISAAEAADFIYGGVVYTVTNDTPGSRTCEVGNNQAVDLTLNSEIIIPQYAYNGEIRYTVTGIGDHAFGHIDNMSVDNNHTLTGITADYVTYIGVEAFFDCTNLANVSFSAAESIGAYAFYGCASLTGASFPAAESIGGSAFYGCSSLASISFPAAGNISGWAFAHCTSLTSVSSISFPAVKSIGGRAFTGCTDLVSVSFPDAENIGVRAFSVCISLTSVSFPSVKSIAASAFSGCASLAALILPSTPPVLGDNVFEYAPGPFTIQTPGEPAEVRVAYKDAWEPYVPGFDNIFTSFEKTQSSPPDSGGDSSNYGNSDDSGCDAGAMQLAGILALIGLAVRRCWKQYRL
jgi:hypothetical protein